MKCHKNKSGKELAGFTLIELMVVMTVIALLMGLAVTGLNGVTKSGGLAQTMDVINSELSLARQASRVENREFEVRFLKLKDLRSARDEEEYRAFQIVKRLTVTDPEAEGYSRPGTEDFVAEAIPVSPIRYFSDGVVLVDDLEKSTLLLDPSRKGDDPTPIPDSTESAEYSYFRFTAEGGTDLDRKKKWFFTLSSELDAEKETIDNFATLQVEPTTGKLIWFRP